jgi:signal transduction histidine kinase
VKLVLKLTLALVLGIAVVMAGYAGWEVTREGGLFEAELAKDQRVMARALRPAVEAAWRSGGQERARALVAQADEAERGVRIRLVDLDAPRGRPDSPGIPEDRLGPALAGTETILVGSDEEGGERRFTYEPVSVSGGGPRAALELSESLAAERGYIWHSELQTVITMIVILAVCGLIAIVVGLGMVGRPIRRLSDQLRRVGGGDFSVRLGLRQRDELGVLGNEIDAMCDRLAEANRRVLAESDAKIAALEQLRHADRLKTVGQLASGVAHELGTPLNVIGARAKMIVSGEVAGDSVVANARIIAEQSARMTTIIRQLLDFSRRRGPRLATTRLDRLAAGTLAMLSTLIAKRRVTPVLDAATGPLEVLADEHQLQQALTNLVLNAIQAMPQGGKLHVAVRRVDARPPADHGGPPGQYLALLVEDEGTGIPPESLPHVFEPFYTTKAVGEGTGLGLSVAYGIVHDHGGWIDVESEPGRGSRFTIFLRPAPPVAATERESAA